MGRRRLLVTFVKTSFSADIYYEIDVGLDLYAVYPVLRRKKAPLCRKMKGYINELLPRSEKGSAG